MNRLIVGADPSPILDDLPEPFLFIDDDTTTVPRPKRRKVVELDLTTHCYNPLKGMDYKRARDFLALVNALFPEGENTLTRKAANLELLKALKANPKRLDQLTFSKDPGGMDARQKIETLLLSPVLNRFLLGTTNLSLSGVVIAKLDRSLLGDFDCYAIANILISAYKGHVVVPDFGFYGHKGHVSLIRQNRLIAGVHHLDHPLKNDLLLIKDKVPSRCTAKDAETLAAYRGLLPGTVDFSDFVSASVA